ncbi:MAG TPA: LuxR C-terminal-related transcriptional regulator, partial [Anaerolineae bacterium]|nr:LuxR C-terminal-related transcriptional regulator [Anaerolineae bacterium]
PHPLAFAWLSLDEADNDPTRFLGYLLAALEPVCPDIGAEAQGMLQPPQSLPLPAILTPVINRLAAAPPVGDWVLALDDYHVIEQPAIHAAVTFLLDHMPPWMRLVIAGRADPPLPLPRLRARRQLTELRAADLRFTADEAATFLNRLMGLNLTPEALAALEAHTEGWIAGLQLAALSLQNRDAAGAAQFIAAFSGSHRHVIDYLTEEVLAQQPAEIHQFLSQTAILNRLTAPLCDAVTGRDDSERLLRQLEQANLFLAPLDDERRWYRYHRLFADFMRNHLQGETPELACTLHRRAAAWCAQHALLAEAIEHALHAADFESAAQWIEQAALPLLMRSEAAAILHWIKSLPESLVRARPALNLFYAEAALIAGEFELIEAALQAVETALDGGAVPVEDQGALVSQVMAVRAYMATFDGDLRRSIELAQRALAALPEDNAFLHSIVGWLLGLSQFFDTNIGEARRVFDETLTLSQATGNVLMASLSIFVSGYLLMMQGRLRQARATFAQGLAALSGDAQALPLSASLIYQGLAEIRRETNALEDAAQAIQECVTLGEAWGNAEVLVDSYIVQARIYQARGDEMTARALLAKIMPFAHEAKVSLLTIRQIEAFQARMQLAWGEGDAAALWAESRGEVLAHEPLPEGNIAVFIHWVEVSALARFYLAHGRPAAALDILRPLREAVETVGWLGIAIDLLGLESLALHGMGQREAAHTVLRRALTLAAPEGYTRVFVEMGEEMTAMLQAVQEQGFMPEYIQTLLQVKRQTSNVKRPSPTSPNPQPTTLNPQPLIEPLSDRELEVLALVTDGATNREIADRLYIAASTVKTHINNLYGKLGAANRVQAVARARELGLVK